MMKNKNIMQKIRKVGKIMGDRVVFRIGVDSKNGRVDLLSVDVCYLGEREKEVIAELPEMDYIG